MTYRSDFISENPTADLIALELAGFNNVVCEDNIIGIYLEDLNLVDKIPLKNKIATTKVSRWQNSWLKNYQGFEVDHQLIILPEQDQNHYPHPIQIKLDPENAFGDGHHPTTKMVLKVLKQRLLTYTNNTKQLDFLDLGCGTGLFTILAGKLGVKNLTALDIASEAVKQTRKNLKLNQLQATVYQQDLNTLTVTKRYDLITANLLTKVIIENIHKLKALTKNHGQIIVSGISQQWTQEAFNCFKDNRLKVSRQIEEQGWNCFLLLNQ